MVTLIIRLSTVRCLNVSEYIPIKDSLHNVLKQITAQSADVFAFILDNWAQIVGDEIAQKLKPIKLQKETLYLSASDPSWLVQGSFLEERILKSVHKEIKNANISRIKITLVC
jgi:predicted nucleic acid-binding Zn ribbon protein